MTTFKYSIETPHIPLDIWASALDSIRSAIAILDIASRPKFVHTLIDSIKDKNPSHVDFVTFLGSLISIKAGTDIFGSIEGCAPNSKFFNFAVEGRGNYHVAKKNVRIHDINNN